MPETNTAISQDFYAVNLGVKDVPALRAFYERWGWNAKPYSSDQYLAINLNGAIVAFVQRDLLGAEAAPGEPATENGWNGVSLALNLPTRESVDVTWEAAVAAGARLVGEPQDRPWGGRSGYVADPEGTRWEITWVPAELM